MLHCFLISNRNMAMRKGRECTFNENALRDIIRNRNLNELFQTSVRKDYSAWAELCESIGTKNSFKNRLKIYQFCKRHFGDISIRHNISPKICILSQYILKKKNCSLRDSVDINIIPCKSHHELESTEQSKESLNSLHESDLSAKNVSTSSAVSTDDEQIAKPILKVSCSSRTAILPKGSNNLLLKTSQRPKFKSCNFYEGSFTITHEELTSIVDSNTKLLPGLWTYTIAKKIQTVNNTCVLNFKHSRFIKKKNIIKIYAYCAHAGCKVFILEIRNTSLSNNHDVSVYSSSLNFNHISKLTRYLKGVERTMFKKNNKHEKPMILRQQSIKTSSKTLIKEGNLQDIKSNEVFRKCRSEMLGSLDRDKDDLIDLIKFQRDNPSYVKMVSQPLQICIYSNQQLDILNKELKANIDLRVHLDATGSIIRKPQACSKKIYYYAIVIKCSFNDSVCPITEMVSSNHDTTTIGIWLAKFKSFITFNKKKWPLFKNVVTDFSFALINAATLFWNNMDLKTYLLITFNAIESNNNSKIDKLVKIFICCSHFFKIISNDINTFFVNYTERTFFKEVLAGAFNITNFGNMCEWFSHLVIVLNSKFVNEHVLKSTALLMEFSINENNFNTEDFKMLDSREMHFHSSEQLYKSSPFYSKFYLLYENVMNSGKCSTAEYHKPENKYYNPDFLKTALKKYFPYLPLWSGLLAKNKRPNNSYVENWFSIVKNVILKGQFNQKCSRVIRNIRKQVLTIHKEISLDIPKKRCSRKSGIISDCVTALQAEEFWQKRLPTKNNNFSGTFLKKTLGSLKTKSRQAAENIFANGLMENLKYYKASSKYGNYVICKFSGLTCNELRFQDFDTLSGRAWLSDAVINCCILSILKLFSTDKKCTFFSVETSFAIFNYFTELENSFYFDIPPLSTNDLQIIPLNVNRNHWCIIFVDFERKKMIYIDPSGNENLNKKIEYYKSTFTSFIETYKKMKKIEIDTTNFSVEFLHHITQKDTYNCGVYILYFCQQFIQNKSLGEPLDIMLFRDELKKYLLTCSSDVSQMCLVCGDIVADSFNCMTCFRKFHKKCTSYITNCDLCAQSS